jgi:hypothetical protein
MAPNLQDMISIPDGVEVWPSNDPRGYRKKLRYMLEQRLWTRWFNLHSRTHMESTYPTGFQWYKDQPADLPIYFQKEWSDIKASVAFPRKRIQEALATAKGPQRYFTCSVCWLIAFAIVEGFERIELWGFMLRDKKTKGELYEHERPCFFYWVNEARRRGIDVWYQPEIEQLPFLPGDPDTYDGVLYGYGTRPEPDWVED